MNTGKPSSPPKMIDLLDMHRADIGAKLRVALPGTIYAYDRDKHTASVVLGNNAKLNDGTVVQDNTHLLDVPVFTMQGGGVHVGFPILPGDECLVIFADINIDAWHAAGGQQTPNDARRHSINDGFALVGPNSLRNTPVLPTALLETEGGLSTALTKIAIDSDTELVTIANGTANLAIALKALLTALTALNTGIAAESGVIPTAAAAATAANTAIALVQAQLDALLY